MKPLLIALLLILSLGFLPGCTPEKESVAYQPEYKPVKQVGTVPDAWTDVVAQNRLGSVRFTRGGLFTCEEREDGALIRRLDHMGNELAVCEVEGRYFRVSQVIGTSDGGFLGVLGFSDRWLSGASEGKMASDDGILSRVVKCAADGDIEWTADLLNMEGSMFQVCFESEDGYVFIGDRQTPETRRRGVHSPNDLSFLRLDHQGNFVMIRTIGGSDYDSLLRAIQSEDGYVVYGSVQSRDGDFSFLAGHGLHPICVRIRLDRELNVLDITESDRRPDYGDPIGTLNGQFIYAREGIMEGYDAGFPFLVLDEGADYLVVSRNETGVYEHKPPFISAIWCYEETVYSAFDKSGKLLWRTAVDSSPDYDALLEEIGN